jgi:hypothetical protein
MEKTNATFDGLFLAIACFAALGSDRGGSSTSAPFQTTEVSGQKLIKSSSLWDGNSRLPSVANNDFLHPIEADFRELKISSQETLATLILQRFIGVRQFISALFQLG